MTILVYGEKASRTHENQMLQVFLERLEDRWLVSRSANNSTGPFEFRED